MKKKIFGNCRQNNRETRAIQPHFHLSLGVDIINTQLQVISGGNVVEHDSSNPVVLGLSITTSPTGGRRLGQPSVASHVLPQHPTGRLRCPVRPECHPAVRRPGRGQSGAGPHLAHVFRQCQCQHGRPALWTVRLHLCPPWEEFESVGWF